MWRLALGAFAVGVALVGALLISSLLRIGPAWPAAGPFVVKGHLVDAGGRPARGVKVWLNAEPSEPVARAAENAHRPVTVTVVGSSVTSATGAYAIRVGSVGRLASGATDGVVRFTVMAGNRAGWATGSFTGRLVRTVIGPRLVLPPGGVTVTDLHLVRPYLPLLAH